MSKLKTIKLLAALAAVCCFSSAFADSVRVLGKEATIGSATQTSGGYRWEGGQSTMTITFDTPAGCTEGDTLLFSELKMVSAGDDGNSYTGAYGRRLSIEVDDVTYTSGKVILTESSAIGELTGQNVLTYIFPNVPVKAGASYTLTLLDRPEGKTGVRYAVTNTGSIIYVGSSDDGYKPIAVAAVTPVLTSNPVAGSMILLSNTATSGAVSESGAGECNLTLSIPESDALPLGTVVRVKKINLASWNDTFKDWDTTNNKSDPYFIKVNNVKSLSIVGTTTDPGSAPTTDLTTATILANETTALNRLSFAFAETCDLTVGNEYPAASGNNASTGVALLYRNGNLCYGGSQDRAAVRYVESDTPSILSSAAASGAYPIYEMYAEVLGNVTVKADETVSISELNTQAADAVLMVTIESGATVNIDATPVENVEFYGDNFSLYNGVVTANGVAVRVMEGATLANLGAKRDFSGWAVDDGVTVSITQTTAEYGKGVTTVMNAENVSAVTVLDPTGAVAGTITPASSTTLETSAKVSGKACWIDYEMDYGSGKTGFENTGTSSLALQEDSSISGSNAFTDDGMLYTYAHPYRQGLTIPSTWTAVVRCTVPNYPDAAVIIFGWNNNYIGLVAGETPKTEMRLVQYKTGYDHYVTNAVMNVQDATTAQHVYVFAVENSQTLKVYCDGSVILDKELDEPLTITSGFQVGSVLGGAAGGIVRFAKNESPANTLAESVQKDARIDCVRLYDYSLSADQLAALSAEFPAVKLYEATVEADSNTTWGALDWSNDWDGGNEYSKVLLTVEGDATVELPESITAEELAFEVAPGSTLTLKGPGSLAVTRAIDAVGFTLKLAGTVTLDADTTFAGNVVFGADFEKAGDGAIQLANGATVGVDAALVVTALGDYTCAEGTVVDSAYTGDGVKLIPLTSAVVSITQDTTTLYYSDLDTALAPLINTPGTISEDVEVTLLNGTVLPFGYDTFLQQAGYYIDGNVITRAVAQIGTPTYPTLAAAVEAAQDGATVKLLLASSEAITLSDKAITLSETANFSGTLTGNGTLTFAAFRNNPSITFTDWTGTVVLPEFAANGTILNKYGVTGSTVVLKGITAGWLGETSSQKMDVNPVLQLDGDVTIKGFSTSWDYTFAEITGAGDFSLDPTDNSPKSATIGKVAKGFTGAINNGTTVTLTIGTLDREEGTGTEVGDKLLDTTGDVVAEALTVAGEPVDVRLVTEADGIYVGAPVVAVIGETPYTSLADAVAAAADGDTVKLVADVDVIETGLTFPADTTVTFDLNGYTLTAGNGATSHVQVNGVVTITDSSEGAEGQIVSGEAGTYGLVQVAENNTQEGAALTIAGGTIEAYFPDTLNDDNQHPAYGVVVKGKDTVFNMTGGKVKAGLMAVMGHGSKASAGTYTISGGTIESVDDFALYLPTKNGCSVTISGGTFIGQGGVGVRAGTLNVTGGTFTASGTGIAPGAKSGTTGLSFAGLAVWPNYGAIEVTVSGGMFTSATGVDAVVSTASKFTADISLTGGIYSTDVTDFCATGYEATEDNGVWTVDVVTDPTIGGETVEPAKVFDTATTAEGIVYPTAPTVSGEPGSQTITYKDTVVEVPAYYTATLSGTTVTLALNSNALPTIGATEASGDDEAVPATEVTDETFGLGLTTTSTKLYYGLATCDTPSGTFAEPTTLTQGTGKAMSLKANRGTNENVKFYKVFVTDIAPAQ